MPAADADGRSLSEQDQRFRIMADVAPVMIWMAGLDKLCNFFNQPWLDFTGRSMAQEMGNGWTEGVHPDDMDSCIKTYTESFDARRDFRMEYRLRRRDGEFRWILDTGRPVYSSDGAFSGYIGSCIDITDLKQANEKNLRLQEQIYQAQKMEAIGQLAAGIAHDMKNLLLAIQGNAELIVQESEPGTQVNTQAARISASSARASDMIRKLLLFGRKHPLSREWLDMGSVAVNIMALVGEIIPPGIEVVFRRPEESWGVFADRALIEQIIVNLVTNARDAISGKGEIVISVENIERPGALPEGAASNGTYVCLGVSDNGSGMSPEVRNRIFEPFYTSKTEGRGTGLGLAIVHGIVMEHGGWVEVESAAGSGSTFRCYLPADPSVHPR
jgi:PAS domain S-box-containing protein